MNEHSGDPAFPILLLGDSNPKNGQNRLKMRLDPRHPARHNIWTPVIDETPDIIYKKGKKRVNTSTICTRNALQEPSNKPSPNDVQWNDAIEKRIREFAWKVQLHLPIVLISFGLSSVEFAHRAQGEPTKRNLKYWGAEHLGDEFWSKIGSFSVNAVNVISLLHVSIARGHFVESHESFSSSSGIITSGILQN
jgi:hypothetical protein